MFYTRYGVWNHFSCNDSYRNCFMILLGLAAQKMADSQYETYRVLSNHFVDTLKGLETLKYLGQSKQHEGKIEK